MEDAGIQKEVHRRAVAQGHNPATMSHAVYQKIVRKIYSDQGKLLNAGVEVSKAGVRAVIKSMSADKIRETAIFCESCPHGMFKKIKVNKSDTFIPACDACGCSGSKLRLKWKDPKSHCPLTVGGKRCDKFGNTSPNDPDDPPCWDNRGSNIELKTRSSSGDETGTI